jgi:hypothetical protein
MSSRTPDDGLPVACTPDLIPATLRERWVEVGIQFYAAVEELKELPDGYACRLPSDAATLLLAAEYVSLDRQCCRFVRWELCAEPNLGPLWLRITGPDGTKQVARQAFEHIDLVREEVLRAAGLEVKCRTDPRVATCG